MPSLHQSVPQLRRRRLGVMHLVFFTIAASAPLTVLSSTFDLNATYNRLLSFTDEEVEPGMPVPGLQGRAVELESH